MIKIADNQIDRGIPIIQAEPVIIEQRDGSVTPSVIANALSYLGAALTYNSNYITYSG